MAGDEPEGRCMCDTSPVHVILTSWCDSYEFHRPPPSARACQLLENPDLTIATVAAHCGLGSLSNLRLHLRRAYATTPTAYRDAFT